MKIRLLIADDHLLVAEGLMAIVSTRDDMQVVHTVDNGQDAVAAAKEFEPDVILMDISMPQLNGIEASRAVLKQQPEAKIIVLSMHSNPEYVRRALDAGVRGYILKRTAASNLVEGIQRVNSGHHYFCRQITDLVVNRFLHGPSVPNVLDVLSTRELQVLQMLAESKSTVEIAKLLHLSPKTIETYRARLFEKLGLKDIAGLVRLAVRQGVISLD